MSSKGLSRYSSTSPTNSQRINTTTNVINAVEKKPTSTIVYNSINMHQQQLRQQPAKSQAIQQQQQQQQPQIQSSEQPTKRLNQSQYSMSGSDTDVSTSNENLSVEQRYVLRTPRVEPQGQENLFEISNNSNETTG